MGRSPRSWAGLPLQKRLVTYFEITLRMICGPIWIVHARYPGASGNSRSGVALMARRRNWSPVLFRNQAGAQAPLFGGCMMALYFADGSLAAPPLRPWGFTPPASLVGRSPRGIRGLFDQTQRQRDADTGAA